MKKTKRLISVILMSLMLLAICGNAMAIGSATTVYIPNMDANINAGLMQFQDAHNRSYDEVKAIMSAQHPYLVKFSKVTSEWINSNSFPDYFAGAYFRNDTEFVVKTTTTNATTVQTVKDLFGNSSSIEAAKYSYAELLDKQAQINKEVKNNNFEVRTWINMAANVVEVEIAREAEGKVVASNAFINKVSTEPYSISYIDNFTVMPTASIGNNTGCYYTATGHTSSLGCWITHNGVNKIICAGHSPNGVTGTSSRVYTSSSQSTQIGYISYAQYNPNTTTAGDFAFITVNTSHSPANGNQTVSGFYTSSIIPNNTYVYRSGKTSSSSGYVLQTGATIRYSGDTGQRTGMVQAEYTTTVGESGNAVVAGNNLLIGIQGGGTGPSYFTPWSTIYSALQSIS